MDQKHEINPGDVVKLIKIDGPKMLVIGTITKKDSVTCYWFRDGELCIGEFQVRFLIPVKG